MMTMVQILLVTLMSIAGPSSSPADKPDMPEKYRRWVEEEVVYIISEKEREVFYKLENNEQRDRFIEEFWEQRDPTPGSEKNEFKEEHYKRIEYANKWLGRETAAPGWKTDRGKIYIQLGEPKQKRAYYSHQKLQPMEIWFYQADPLRGVPSFFYCIFFKKYGTGDYVLYDPTLHGPEQLIFLNAGQAPEEAPMLIADYDMELAMASISLVPTEPADIESYKGRPALSSIQLMAQLENLPNYRRDATYAERILRGEPKVETNYTFDSSGLPMNLFVMKMPNGVPVIDFAFHFPTSKFELGQYEDTVYGALEATLSAMNENSESVLLDRTALDQEFNQQQATMIENGGYTFQGQEILLPGTYDVTLTVRNKVSKIFYTTTQKLEVPFRRTNRLQVMRPVLYPESDSSRPFNPAAVEPYKFDTLKFLPLLSETVRRGQVLGVFYQVNTPLPEQGEQWVPVQVQYRVVDIEGNAAVEKTVWLGPKQYDQFGTASVIWQFSTEELNPASTYRLEITASQGETESVAISDPFNVSDTGGLTPGYVKYDKPINFLGPESYVSQARQLMAIDRPETAAALLEQVVDNFKLTQELHGTYAEALAASGKSEKAIDLLQELSLRFPEEHKWQRELGLIYLQTGRYDKAIGYLERIRLEEGDSPEVLNPLGEAYFRSERTDKAREMWRRSLAIDSNQPTIKQRLEQ
jgi:GWxTD domain-containing protein